MIIVQISDTHISQAGHKTFGVAPMAQNLARCIDSINALQPKPDLVLLSGDVTNDGTGAQAQEAARILSRLTCPFYLVPGNHDDRDALFDTFGDGACPSRDQGFFNYVIEGHPLRIIALDSMISGQAGGHLCPTRLTWLHDCLARGGKKPTIIFMHHPPLKLGVPETDADGFAGADQMGDIVAEFPNIERILCGHIHLTTHTRWRGTLVSTAPSPGMQSTFDLTQSSPSQFVLSDPAYLLHHWCADQTLVSHVIQLTDPEGPFAFA